jgi:ribonuclease P protein component
VSEAREAKAGSAVAPQQNPVQLQHAQAAFPKAARLLKTDEFSSVFRLRPWRRTPHFVVYARPTGNDARLGLVIGKKFAARAATRNLIKRQSREAFRLRRAEFGGWDVLLRLHTRIDKKAFPSAASLPLKALARGEIETLLDKVAREIKRREAMPVGSDEAAASSKAQRASDAPGASSGTASPGTSAAGETPAVAAAPAKVSSKPQRSKP